MKNKILALFLVFVLLIPTTLISVFAEDTSVEVIDNEIVTDSSDTVTDVTVEGDIIVEDTESVMSETESDTVSEQAEPDAAVELFTAAAETAAAPEKSVISNSSELVRTNEEMPALSVGYTVDFVYGDYLYSIEGGSSILLSELFAELNIDIDVDRVADIEFTNYDYIDISMEGNQWRLTSLMAFISEEALTVTLTDSTVITIGVYDSSPVISEAAGNFIVLYYTTQKDPSGKDVTGIYWYSNTTGVYNPVAYWGAPEVSHDYICTTIEQALEWACVNVGLGQLNGGNVQGIRVYITEMYHVPAGGEIWGQDYLSAHRPGFAFVPTQVLRAPGYEGEMIHIHTDFNKHLYAQNNVVIDNASAHCPDVENPIAIRVADGGLMIADGCIIMDTTIPSDPVNKTGYKGTGVLLTTMNPEDKVYPMVELNGGALELVGNTQIHHFAMAVDSDYGVTRLREPSPTLGTWNIDNNILSVNLAYGTYLGKWCDDISQINNVSVFLEDVEKWSSGDIILASGYKSNPVVGQPDIKTSVIPNDRNKIVIQNQMDLSYSMAVKYYGGITTDPYPVIRFEIASVFNVQLETWYFTLYEAVAASRANDELVFYNSTNEGSTVMIPHNLTIRSSYKGEMPGGKTDIRAGNNCTATWNSNRFVNAVMVGASTNSSNPMTVVFGTNDTTKEYGELTFDTNSKARHLENFGTAYLYGNFTLIRGKCEYGGSICSVGFTYLDGAEIVNSTAGTNGNGGAIAVTNGALYFKSGLIDNCSANNGGAIFNNYGGTVEMSGGQISYCTANKGGAVYQNGTFRIGGKVIFTKNTVEDFYLPTTATIDNSADNFVIIKDADITLGSSNPITVTLGNGVDNYFHGRNIVVTGNARVSTADKAKFELTTNSVDDKNIYDHFKYVYTALDKTVNNLNKPVLELIVPLGKLKITKSVELINGVKLDPEQAFIFDIVGADAYNKNYKVTVVVYGEGEIVIGELPCGKYTVTERSSWSWRYGTDKVQVSVDNGSAVTSYTATATVKENRTAVVKFINEFTKNKWLSDSAYANNKFNKV